jgi:SAM-dependent methyltransferase
MVGKPEHTTAADLEWFIEQATVTGYQRVVLPDGRVIPGRDRAPTANRVYPTDLTGKTVLDVGCYYGFFLHEAIRRGARKAVGVEMDPDRFRAANAVAALWEGRVQVKQGMLEEVTLDEQFDLVLFLNVLHHVSDPIQVMKKLASLCRGMLVVEFRQLHDPQFVTDGFHGSQSLHSVDVPRFRRAARRVKSGIQSPLIEWISRRLPVIGVGDVQYHRSYFFTKAAFRNTFTIHNPIFESIDFQPSVRRGQTLAFCQIRR